jgi:hypothetical protein
MTLGDLYIDGVDTGTSPTFVERGDREMGIG